MHKKLIFAVPVSFVVVVFGAAFYLSSRSEAATDTTRNLSPASRGQFAQIAAALPGWDVGPQSADSFLMFKRGSDCFVSLNRDQGGLDIAQAQTQHRSDLTSTGSSVGEELEQTLAMSTATKSVPYVLRTYVVTGSNTYPAQAYGYADLGSFSVKVVANCSSSDGLASAVAALPDLRLVH